MTDRAGWAFGAHAAVYPGVRRAWYLAVRAIREAELAWFIALLALTLLAATLSGVFRDAWPLAVYLLPLLLALDVLSWLRLLVLEAVTAMCLAYTLAVIHITPLRILSATVVVVGAGIVAFHNRSRTRLGLLPQRGDAMLVDLRDRLASQSVLPELPRGWHAEAVTRSAGGASFSGDFMVAARTLGGRRLEIVVVDVSGKGLHAGTRSLQLSGAFGGLLGALPTAEFLSAANCYLLRQEWAEGFASAAHLAVDLDTGDFEVRTAGHPPALQFYSGSGEWVAHRTGGPVLGVLEGAVYPPYRGHLQAADALLLYTDGLVEAPHRNIEFGIDKLLGEAERLIGSGFAGGAEQLVASVRSERDDRALFLLYRG